MKGCVVRISLSDNRIQIAGADARGTGINSDGWIIQKSVESRDIGDCDSGEARSSPEFRAVRAGRGTVQVGRRRSIDPNAIVIGRLRKVQVDDVELIARGIRDDAGGSKDGNEELILRCQDERQSTFEIGSAI